MLCSTYSLNLLQNCVLDVDVLEHSFNNHVSLFKATVVQRASQVGQYRVSLKGCDALLFGLVIKTS